MILCDECDDGSSPTRAPTLSTSNAPTLITHGAECDL